MKFLVRIVFVFFVQAIIKVGDSSFVGLFDFSTRGVLFSICFIIYGMVIWYIAEFFNLKLLKRQESTNKKRHTYMLFLFHLIYGFIVSFFANWIYQTADIYFSDNKEEVWHGVTLFNAELTVSLWMIYLMVFSFDNYHKSRIKSKETQLKLEKLEKDNTIAQYLNLKSQIEPHFLFNSLSVLSSLIYSDKDLASEFVLKLSRILRFVIEKNSFLLVPLKEEVTFIDNYIFLIKTRFDDEVIFNSTINEKKISSCYVPPAAIQTLVENAIKHNRFSKENPLRIGVYNSNNRVTVSNNLNLRNHGETSTGKGLDNLKARYSHFTSSLVEITQTEDSFTVSIPLLTKKEYESFNI